MKSITIIFSLLLFLSLTLNAQSNLKNNSPFLGGMAGALNSGSTSDDGRNSLSFVFGGSLGLPVPS